MRRKPIAVVVVNVVELLKVLIVLVVVILAMVIKVHGLARRTLNRRNVTGQARNTRGTAQGNPAAAARPRSSRHTADSHHHGAAALATATNVPLASGSRWASGSASATHTRGTTA